MSLRNIREVLSLLTSSKNRRKSLPSSFFSQWPSPEPTVCQFSEFLHFRIFCTSYIAYKFKFRTTSIFLGLFTKLRWSFPLRLSRGAKKSKEISCHEEFSWVALKLSYLHGRLPYFLNYLSRCLDLLEKSTLYAKFPMWDNLSKKSCDKNLCFTLTFTIIAAICCNFMKIFFIGSVWNYTH